MFIIKKQKSESVPMELPGLYCLFKNCPSSIASTKNNDVTNPGSIPEQATCFIQCKNNIMRCEISEMTEQFSNE